MRKSTHTAEYSALRAELRASRKAAGLSQRELGERLKVPHSWVEKVENGERRIDLVECVWFLVACGIDPHPVLRRVIQRSSASLTRHALKGGR